MTGLCREAKCYPPFPSHDRQSFEATDTAADAAPPAHRRVETSHARVAELVDALDLESSANAWGFKSPLSHQIRPFRVFL